MTRNYIFENKYFLVLKRAKINHFYVFNDFYGLSSNFRCRIFYLSARSRGLVNPLLTSGLVDNNTGNNSSSL